jgi:hypothetical protein
MRNKKTYTLWDIEQQQQQQQQQQQPQPPTTQHNTGSAMAAVDTPVPTDSDWDLLQPGFKPLLPQLQGKDASMLTIHQSGAKVVAKGGHQPGRENPGPPTTPDRLYPPGFHGCAGEPPGTDLSRQIPETRPYADDNSYYDWQHREWKPIYTEGGLEGYFIQNNNNQNTAHGHNNNNNNNNQQPCDSGITRPVANHSMPSQAAKAAMPLRPIPENSILLGTGNSMHSASSQPWLPIHTDP